MPEQRIHFINPDTFSRKELLAVQEQYKDNPLSLLDMTPAEAQRVVDRVADFYRQQLADTGLEGYIVGVSGGLDSTMVAYLTAGAVGADRVFGVCLPMMFTTQDDIDDTMDVINTLGITHNDYHAFHENAETVIALLQHMGQPMIDAAFEKIKYGNIQARVRMIVLRDFARAKNYLVAGTSNASERMLGYATLGGDGLGGIDNEGLDQLFKTTERKLGKFLQLPITVMEKIPSARLWEGQTDEGELGISYENVDQILVGYLLKLEPKEIAHAIRREMVTPQKVEEIFERVEKNTFKSQMPRVASLR